jgi:hypothetical protein
LITKSTFQQLVDTRERWQELTKKIEAQSQNGVTFKRHDGNSGPMVAITIAGLTNTIYLDQPHALAVIAGLSSIFVEDQ